MSCPSVHPHWQIPAHFDDVPDFGNEANPDLGAQSCTLLAPGPDAAPTPLAPMAPPVYHGRRYLIMLGRAKSALSELRLYQRPDDSFFIEHWYRHAQAVHIDLGPISRAQACCAFDTELAKTYPPVATRGGIFAPIHDYFGCTQATLH